MVDEFDEMIGAGRRRWIAALTVNGIILTMVALAGYMLLSRSGVITVQSIVASRTSQISADQEGKIVKIFVEENEQIKVGQPLFQIENPDLLTKIQGLQKIIAGYDQQIAEEQSDLNRRLRESDLAVKMQTTRQQIDEKRVSLKNERQTLENADRLVAYAKTDFDKAQTLFTSAALTRARLDSYRLAYEAKLEERKKVAGDIDLLETDIRGDEALLRSYREQLDALTSSIAQRVNELREKKTAAISDLTALESAKERFVRKADRNGSVALRRKEEGEAVKPGEAVLEVTTGEDIWVEAYFRPEDLSFVQVGDRLVVRYANQLFPASVESIGLISKPFPLQRVSMLAAPENLVVVKLQFAQSDQVKKTGLRPGTLVNTELTRREGLLYRLGLKQARDGQTQAARTEGKEK
jgi:membrane fusion protein (multidrug efflux system)